MAKRKFTPPTEFLAEYVDGNGNKAVILGRGPHADFPFIGYDANGYAATWTELGKYHDAWLEAEAKIVELEAKLAADRTEVIALIRKDAENGDISHGAAQWVIDTILAELKD